MLILFSGFITTQTKATLTQNQKNELEYLKLKLEVVQENISNANKKGFIPKVVIQMKNVGPLIAPQTNPYRKVYDPLDADSNEQGMVFYPNINLQKESQALKKIKLKIKQFEDIHFKKSNLKWHQ